MTQGTPRLPKPNYTTMAADEAATMAFGAQLAALLRPGDIIRLEGDLGVGKSCLARGLIRQFCGQTAEVPSPTFSLVQMYEPAGAAPIWHFDLYRLERPEEIYELGLEEALEAGLCVVEWPEKVGAILPTEGIRIKIGFDRRQHTLKTSIEEGRPAGRVISLFALDEAMASRLETFLEQDQ